MSRGRAARLLGGLGLGYLHTLATVLVALWLTPFLLSELGSHDYGLWLLGTQVVFYLALLDLGVVALVPREVAGVCGRSDKDRHAGVRDIVGQVGRLSLWQVPAVAIAGAVAVWLLPSEWALLRGPVGMVVLAFVLAFPFRVLMAVLQGLQDLAFVSGTQFLSWAAGTVATITGVVCGLGLYSLALGWVTTQAVSNAMAWARISRSFPEVLPARLPSLSLVGLRQQIGRGAWISVAQVAQVLLSGLDIVVVGHVLGPAAVVPYVCTGKLITILANQPQMLMQLALPALSELRTSAPRARLIEVSRSMTQVMLLGSGAIVAVVLAINEPFVLWWVGEAQFGGAGLTLLLLSGMLLRHLNVTAVYSLFCFGNERRLAVTTLADGAVGVLATLLLVPKLGLAGAALGPLLGSCLISLPFNIHALSREEGTSPWEMLAPLGPWLVRLVPTVVGVAAVQSLLAVRGLAGVMALTVAVSVAYIAIMSPLLRKPPLDATFYSATRPWVSSLTRIRRRWATHPVTLSH